MQAIATVFIGWIIGLAFQWKLALIGIATTPILISAGYIRMVSTRSVLVVWRFLNFCISVSSS